MPVFHAVADCAILVEFGTAPTAKVVAAIRALDHKLRQSPIAGLTEALPGMVNLLIAFDPLRTDHAAVERAVRGLLTDPSEGSLTGKLHEVQVCYEAEFAPDLAEVAAQSGLAPEQVINAHLAGDYAVLMYGFAPGYAYLTGVPDALHLPRKPIAMPGVPAGSVIIAAAQCLVTTLTMPTGWWVIGRSPTRVLRPDHAQPFLFEVGDHLRFRRIDRAEFDRLDRE